MRIPLVAFLLALAAATPASADTFAVDNGGDGDLSTCSTAANDCTLRGALTRAEATPDADTITLPKLRIALTSPLPQISMPVTIKGAGARSSTVDGAGSVGTVFTSGFGSQTVVRDLKVTGAKRTPGAGDFAVSGGSLLQNVAIVDNQSAGVFADNTTIVDSVIARNTGEGIGGVEAMGSAVISSSTVANNTAVLSGAAPLIGPLVWSGGVINGAGLMEIDHSTIAGNKVVDGAALLTGTNVGSVGVLNPSTVLRSSVIGGGVPPNCGGMIESNGHNVVADGSCRLDGAGDRSNVDPLLGPLANNGGPTDTMALLSGSPAIDAGDACPAVDQRGQSRAQGKTCDAGAFESQFTAATAVTTAPPAAPRPAPTTVPIIPVPASSPARSRDTTPPGLKIEGLARRVTRKSLRKGVNVRLVADEPVSAELELLIAPRRPSIARRSQLALATLPMTSRAGVRTARLKLARALTGAGRIQAELLVVAYDAAANRSVMTVRFTIR